MIRSLEDTVETRTAIIEACLKMNASGINQGTSGNISARTGDDGQDMLITPSGIPYEELEPQMIVRMSLSGLPDESAALKPSSEWHFHQALLRAKPEMAAVVHAHPVHCTTLAIQHEPIPACHYMIAAFGGNSVPMADYHIFGSEALSEAVTGTMRDRLGCLMANHGAVVMGETIDKAFWRMEELEALAKMYIQSRQNGEPHILSDDQMADVVRAFANYGPRDVKTGEPV